jgi:hypothetical protein
MCQRGAACACHKRCWQFWLAPTERDA